VTHTKLLDRLRAKTVPATLGEVAAFVSHSWSDDEGGAKYEQLMELFPPSTDAKPQLVWLDKACIDRSDIRQSLLCLPIFLSGCQQLVVLAGPMFPTRLWCVMELFVYVQMGGDRKNIIVRPLGEAADIAPTLASLDASKAKCCFDSDRQQLLAVIEASFGTCAPFNKIARSILMERLSDELGVLAHTDVIENDTRQSSV
jgi:hypothetical protein